MTTPDRDKESDSWKVFRAFLSTLPYSKVSRKDSWTYLSGNNEPDFICYDGKIAVELTGWIDEGAIAEAKTLENFNRKIRDVLHARREEFEGLEGHPVVLEACRVPRGIDWESFARGILAFLVGRIPESPIRRLGNSELPEEMREWFRTVTIYKFPGKGLSVRIWNRVPFDPRAESPDINQVMEESLKESFQSLKLNITKKIQKANKYRVGGARSFTELWLVIHYDDTALEWAAPSLVPMVEFGYGPEARESQRKLAERVRSECLNNLQVALFNKVYLLFTDEMPPLAERLWP